MLVSLRKGGQGEILQQHIQPPGLGADRPGDFAVRTVQRIHFFCGDWKSVWEECFGVLPRPVDPERY